MARNCAIDCDECDQSVCVIGSHETSIDTDKKQTKTNKQKYKTKKRAV